MQTKTPYKNKKNIIIIVFLIILLLRIPYITNSPAEAGDYWRQPDTESIARNFVQHRFNIFYPQFNYDGARPNYVQLELQITTFLIAILYKLFGYHIWLARLVPIGFFMGSVYFLYLIAKRFYNAIQALISMIIYGTIPITVFYSRAIMPESALLCFFTGAFYLFVKWYDTGKLSYLFASGLFTCLAISQKIPAAFIGLAMLAMCLYKYGLRTFLRWELWVFAAISLAPNALYFLWAGDMAESTFVSGIAAKHIIPKFLTAVSTPQAVQFYKVQLYSCFTLPILILAIPGLFSTFRKSEYPILFFALSMLLEAVFIVSVIRLRYYLILLAPIAALLSGRLLGTLWHRHLTTKLVLFAVLVLITANSYALVINDFKEIAWIETAAEIVNTYTRPEDLILIGTEHPSILSMSDRAGWRANIKYYECIPKDIAGGMDYYIQNGAKYFLVHNNFIVKDNGEYIRYLNQNFEKTDYGQGFVMYKLR